MTVLGITSATRPNTSKVEATGDGAAHEPATSHAVVAVEPTTRTAPLRTVRPDASFVAHLIAMAEYAPQTRTLQRETPAAAQVTYNRMLVRGTDSYGKVVSQVA